jgi:tetratricopeptide (TPR) repeat protein
MIRVGIVLIYLVGTAAWGAPQTLPADETAMGRLREAVPPGPEPRLRWDWEPGAFETLSHPVPQDFEWRIRELSRPDLPPVALARLSLELAVLTEAARRITDDRNPDFRADVSFEGLSAIDAGKLGSMARMQYRKLLAGHPGHGEFLADLGDVYRLLGRADSALAAYREALSAPRPPSRVFATLASAEIGQLGAAPDSLVVERLGEIRSAGLEFFSQEPPADSVVRARFLLDHAQFRIAQALAEAAVDRHRKAGDPAGAGADSVFALLARIVSPDNRKLAARAAETDTTFASAHAVLGSLVAGQILLPIAARGILARERIGDADSLALSLRYLAEERRAQRLPDLQYAAANLNRCESLEPARFTRVRVEQARLALVFGDWDGAAGLWRAMAARHPSREDFVEELYSTYRLEAAGAPGGKREAAARLGSFLAEAAPSARNGNIVALLGWTMTLSGDREAARDAFARAVGIDSTSWRGHLGLAVHHLNLLDPALAEPHLRMAGDRFSTLDDPGRSVYCGLVGMLYQVRRDVPNARRWLEEAVAFDPRNAAARGALEDLQRAMPRR